MTFEYTLVPEKEETLSEIFQKKLVTKEGIEGWLLEIAEEINSSDLEREIYNSIKDSKLFETKTSVSGIFVLTSYKKDNNKSHYLQSKVFPLPYSFERLEIFLKTDENYIHPTPLTGLLDSCYLLFRKISETELGLDILLNKENPILKKNKFQKPKRRCCC